MSASVFVRLGFTVIFMFVFRGIDVYFGIDGLSVGAVFLCTDLIKIHYLKWLETRYRWVCLLFIALIGYFNFPTWPSLLIVIWFILSEAARCSQNFLDTSLEHTSAQQTLPTPQVPPSVPTPQAQQTLPTPQVPPSVPTPQAQQTLPTPQVPPSVPIPQAQQTLPTPQVPPSESIAQAQQTLPTPQVPPSVSMPQAQQTNPNVPRTVAGFICVPSKPTFDFMRVPYLAQHFSLASRDEVLHNIDLLNSSDRLKKPLRLDFNFIAYLSNGESVYGRRENDFPIQMRTPDDAILGHQLLVTYDIDALSRVQYAATRLGDNGHLRPYNPRKISEFCQHLM